MEKNKIQWVVFDVDRNYIKIFDNVKDAKQDARFQTGANRASHIYKYDGQPMYEFNTPTKYANERIETYLVASNLMSNVQDVFEEYEKNIDFFK